MLESAVNNFDNHLNHEISRLNQYNKNPYNIYILIINHITGCISNAILLFL
jgi:hypothetical protein